jgi:hypothetical protein
MSRNRQHQAKGNHHANLWQGQAEKPRRRKGTGQGTGQGTGPDKRQALHLGTFLVGADATIWP